MKMVEIQITCADGFELAGALYQPDSVKGAVMIAPATGIKRIFYQSLASFLAENGYGVICFDNRGIGNSKKGSINKVNASLVSWGTLDMPAVLETLKGAFPDVTCHLIGHSAGGQLAGLMHNATELRSMCNLASSSGSLANMPWIFKLKAHWFMNVFIPANNVFFGHANTQWVGMGERLPKLVAEQWRKWCNGKGYVEMDFGKAIQKHWYNDLTFPTQWVHATDDPIANYKNVQDMIRVYTKIKADIITLDPDKEGLKDIGHMKFFSSKNKALWNYVLNWLDSNLEL